MASKRRRAMGMQTFCSGLAGLTYPNTSLLSLFPCHFISMTFLETPGVAARLNTTPTITIALNLFVMVVGSGVCIA